MENPKITKVRKFTIIHEVYEGDRYIERRENDGFNALELIGILEKAKVQIIQQINGHLPQPEKVVRTIVVDKEQVTAQMTFHVVEHDKKAE